MAVPIGLAIAAGGAIIKGIGGLFKSKKARKMEKKNPFPNASVNKNILDNVALAQQLANIGMPQEQYNRGIQNIQRNTTAGIRQLSRTQNNTAGVAGLVRAANDATGDIDTRDALMRRQGQGVLMNTRNNLANEETRVWNWNHRDRYLTNKQEINNLRAAGNANIFGALDTIGQLGIMAEGMGLFGGGGGGQMMPMMGNIGIGNTAGGMPSTNPVIGFPINY